jgi:hypothetical protein
MKVKDSAMQAFPFIEPEQDDNIKAYHPGMTMRDEFAKAAMQGAIAHGLFNADKASSDYAEYVATVAYVYADAMLKARK